MLRHNLKRRMKKYKYQLLIVLIGLAGYWQVAFMQYILKWDMIDQYFPCRYFVSECLRNKIFPFWNPYQHMGYAMHADPQSGVWYPFVWIFSLLGGYDIYANQLEFTLHIILAGIGMFLLINYFVKHDKTAFIIACCYMLSGFFISNAQHLGYILSGTWIPFVLLCYARLCKEVTIKSVVLCALAFYMQITGGYPAFTIVLSYSLLVIFGARVIADIRKKDMDGMKKFILRNFLFFILSLILACGLLISEYLSKDLITRSAKMPLAVSLLYPFSPQSLISCLLPLSSAKDPVFFDTDISMSNLYFGIFCFAFFIVSLFRKKTLFEKIVLFTGLFFLLAAFGKYTPVRTALYYAVPLMNLFRFPSIFRLFALICFLIVTAFTVKELLNGSQVLKKKFSLVLAVMLVMYVVLFIAFSIKTKMDVPDLFSFSFNQSISLVSFDQSIWLQSLISMVIIAAACFLFFRKNKFQFKYLCLFVMCDLFIAAQLNAPVTVIDNTKTTVLKNRMRVIPAKFPVPENSASYNYCDAASPISPLWRSMNTWFKKPAYDGYNNFKMKGYGQLEDEPELLQLLIKNKIAFFSDSYSFYNDTIRELNLLEKNPSHLFFKDDQKNKVLFQNLKCDSTDKASFITFNPEKIVVQSSTSHAQLLSLIQHDFPGWNIFLDGNAVQHFTSDYLFQTIYLPAGNHTVEYRFLRNDLRLLFFISVSALVLCVCFALFMRTKSTMS